MPTDARQLTVWNARCFHRPCHVRRLGCTAGNRQEAEQWAAGHAFQGGKGGHVVALWCMLAGQHRWRPMLLRYGDHITPSGSGWLLWGWLCLNDKTVAVRMPTWMDGSVTATDALSEWWEHDCKGRCHDN